MATLTKEEAQALIKCLIDDFKALKSGDWVPDDDSIEASIEAIWRLQELVEALPCDS